MACCDECWAYDYGKCCNSNCACHPKCECEANPHEKACANQGVEEYMTSYGAFVLCDECKDSGHMSEGR
jgi:hypothetical protein